MQLPQWLARFNRRVTNPVLRLCAGWAPTMGILEHVGRRSGRRYRTPLTVFPTKDGVAIVLTYGPDRDWLKNIAARGEGRITRYGRTFTVRDPRVMAKRDAAPSVTGWMRPVFTLLPFEHAVLLTRG
ncbi:nitroreductase family deazaflavin-dependent oxidoreductase [Mycobacterium sp. E740]|uniref:nitroreductase family deazaflavin-dependent oxidoreductase n=1 Tax=Mycobacterium sp. E740 TaxID=1834149 RepID=UPI0007FF1A18|nr:nitroreductase family deazaflavin-dependent oxidoreductase [Mycobacterium sp. E740]OBI74030.1 peptidase [Mycobacterium sp. E740]